MLFRSRRAIRAGSGATQSLGSCNAGSTPGNGAGNQTLTFPPLRHSIGGITDERPARVYFRRIRNTQGPERMLIQCHACNTKYRLNLEQIPRRKTFVRCKNCGTPIYIDPTEDELPGVGIIPPQEAGGVPVDPPREDVANDGLALVVCPGCEARYRIAAESVQRPGVRLKCTQCGHQFAPPGMPAAPPVGLPQHPRAATAAAAPGASGKREMPLPDEQQMDGLFDDLRPGELAAAETGRFQRPEPELGSLSDRGFDSEAPAPNPEQAYLDAVAFDEDGDTPARPGSVPDDQKFQLFLNPKEFQGSERGMADQPDDKGAAGPDFGIGDVPDPPDLPEPDGPRLPALPAAREATNRDEMSTVREEIGRAHV